MASFGAFTCRTKVILSCSSRYTFTVSSRTRKRAFTFDRIHSILEPINDYARLQAFSSTSNKSEDDNTKVEGNISVSLFKNPIVHQLWTSRQQAKKKSLEEKGARRMERLRNNDATTDVSSQNVSNAPKGKPPSDARVEICYPFSTDAMLWESYRNPWGQIRFGKMLEDLDALAGNIAFFHVDRSDEDFDGDSPVVHPVIVTASVDKITLKERPKVGSNQLLSGQVTWTGRSSMEIRMKCIEEGAKEDWIDAYVTFVTLDPITKKPVPIPPVIPTTPEEIADFEAGEARAASKKLRRKQQNSREGTGSNNEIQQIAEKLLSDAGPLLNMPSLADPYAILLKNTRMQNAVIAQPQAQNLHNRIFGGFLMRRAFELAFSNAYIFGGSRPIFIEVDEVSFNSPVDVGDLLVFNSCVLYTEEEGNVSTYFHDHTNNHEDVKLPLLHIEVEAWVTEPEKVSAKLSNLFSFTFALSRSEISPDRRIRRVLPSNIDEARRIANRIHSDSEQQKQ